jgi:hypothetical protein
MEAPWFGWVIGSFAVGRLTQLLVRDDGPWDLAFKLRRAVGQGALGRALDCFACCSLWCAAPVAGWLGRDAAESVLLWLSMSGSACLLDRLGQPPLTMQALSEPGGDNELLRSESTPVAGSAGPAGPAGPADAACSVAGAATGTVTGAEHAAVAITTAPSIAAATAAGDPAAPSGERRAGGTAISGTR